jgi:predicted MFS family arabinose efflux permease
MVASLAFIVTISIMLFLKPVTAHLAVQHDRTAFAHLWKTISNKDYRIGFTATALLSIGGFMMMPFGSAFAVNNLKITYEQLPFLFMVSGISSLVIMPIVGRLSDKIDKLKIFTVATIWLMIISVLYTNLSATPFWLVIIFNILMMMGIMSRMIPATALTSAVPELEDRGAFMSINSSLQQIAGGIAAAAAGMIVTQPTKFSPIENYNIVGYVIVVISLVTIFLMHRVNEVVKRKMSSTRVIPQPDLLIVE